MTQSRSAVAHDDPKAMHRTASDAENLAVCGEQGPKLRRTHAAIAVTCAACLSDDPVGYGIREVR